MFGNPPSTPSVLGCSICEIVMAVGFKEGVRDGEAGWMGSARLEPVPLSSTKPLKGAGTAWLYEAARSPRPLTPFWLREH